MVGCRGAGAGVGGLPGDGQRARRQGHDYENAGGEPPAQETCHHALRVTCAASTALARRSHLISTTSRSGGVAAPRARPPGCWRSGLGGVVRSADDAVLAVLQAAGVAARPGRPRRHKPAADTVAALDASPPPTADAAHVAAPAATRQPKLILTATRMNSGMHRSHRGGQGFESPQLHPEPQVRAMIRACQAASKIICHPDVTPTRREHVTPCAPG
jgi:hypothetical protein